MSFNRLKIFLLLLVLVFLSLFLWQNQDPLSLKLLCADVNQSCFYQTPKLPLAIWMLIFTLIGMVTSLVWQSLNYLSIKSSSKSKSSASTSYFQEIMYQEVLPQKQNPIRLDHPSNQINLLGDLQ